MKFFDSIKNGSFKDMFKGSVGGACMKIASVKPEILLVAGSISVLAGTIYGIMKAEEGKKVLESAKDTCESIDSALKIVKEHCGDNKEALKKAKIDAGKSYLVLSAHTLYAILQVWGVPILLWFGGMGMIFGAHKELRAINKHLIADFVGLQNAFNDYRQRNAALIGPEAEQRMFMGAQEGVIQVLEKDKETGEERIVEKNANVFMTQPGSIFARNFTEETSDAFDIRSFADKYLEARIDRINKDLELGIARAYTGMDILRMLGFNERALGEEEQMNALVRCGISGNGRKVTDPGMRKLKVTRLEGYQKKWDPVHEIEVYEPCLRLDFNFYPLEGMI